MTKLATIKLIAIATFATTSSFLACGDGGNSSLDGTGNGAGSWGNGGGGPSYSGGDAAATPSQAEAAYRKVQPALESKCGGACHATGATLNAPRWLAGPDSYVSAKAYPGIVVADVYASKLVNRPAGHPAATLVDPGNEQLKADVTTWLTAEAAVLSATPLPGAGPVDLSQGVIDLSTIAAGMAGAKLVFSAQVAGNYARFDSVQLVAPTGTGIHVVAPVFVMVPQDKSPQLADKSYSAVDVSIAAGQTVSLATPFFFFNWIAGSQLKIEFAKFDAATVASPDAGAQPTCKDLAGFQTSAAPELSKSCVGCHGGGNANATGALDLSKLKQNDFAGACEQAHFKLNLANKAQSSLLLAPLAGSGLNHGGGKPYGTTGAAGYQALMAWATKE